MMINVQMKRYAWLFILSLFIPTMALAVVPAWQIVPSESSLTFTATQNNAPVTGSFKHFTGDINYDPNQLKDSKVKIIVDTGSLADPYNQLADTLKGSDWFNVKLFPQAVFEAHQFVKTGDKTYDANGTLTIRDKTLPLTVHFTQEEYSATKARMKGSATLKRTAFGVGQGEWASTDAVKDEVKVDFVVTATKK
jgi:polyisoprenoid-binding protein YceI